MTYRIPAPPSALPSAPPPARRRPTLAERMRRGISEAGLDCACLATAEAVLDRLDAEDSRARRIAGLTDARKMRDAIVLALALLGELDDLSPEEPDRTAFEEIAGLFRDVADFASFGAEAAMRAAGRDGA